MRKKEKMLTDMLNVLEEAEKCLNAGNSNKAIGVMNKVSDAMKKLDIESKKIEAKVDEGLPSESGKYDEMSYEDIIRLALSMENDAVEINLMLIEIATDKKDIERFVEIANDENDHSLIYQSVLNRLGRRK